MKNLLIYKNLYYKLFFIFYFCVGLFIYKDYNITPDEPLHRVNGFISLKYILDLFSININLSDFVESIPSIKNDWRNTYGVIFDLPVAILEVLFKIENIRDVYLIRHLLNFLIFFISTIFFFRLINLHFKSKLMSIFGVLILILSPRIFSHSFYNSRDLVFLSLIIISIYYNVKLLNYQHLKYLILAAVFSAFATNCRIIAIYIPFLTILFYYFKDFEEKSNFSLIKFSIYYLSIYFLIIFLFWPFLWPNPLNNFVYALVESSNYPAWWDFKTLFLGKYLNPEFIPWYYFFLWFFLTTPIFFSILIIFGLFLFLRNLLRSFLRINNNTKDLLWKNRIEMNEVYFFLFFFIPLFFVVTLNSTLYNGWRHLFFLYPLLILFGIKYFNYVYNYLNKKIFSLFLIFLFIQFTLNILFIIQSHPVQNIYFNYIAKHFISNMLPYDYWGSGNKVTIDKLLKLDNSKKIKLSVSSYTNLNKMKKLYNANDKDRLVIFGTANKQLADYIFTNYYYERNPLIAKKYSIPDNFYPYIKLKINGIKINEIYKKK